ncbi:hypothetical protein H312_00571, partial [Anncaliia algerae PRA339]
LLILTVLNAAEVEEKSISFNDVQQEDLEFYKIMCLQKFKLPSLIKSISEFTTVSSKFISGLERDIELINRCVDKELLGETNFEKERVTKYEIILNISEMLKIEFKDKIKDNIVQISNKISNLICPSYSFKISEMSEEGIKFKIINAFSNINKIYESLDEFYTEFFKLFEKINKFGDEKRNLDDESKELFTSCFDKMMNAVRDILSNMKKLKGVVLNLNFIFVHFDLILDFNDKFLTKNVKDAISYYKEIIVNKIKLLNEYKEKFILHTERLKEQATSDFNIFISEDKSKVIFDANESLNKNENRSEVFFSVENFNFAIGYDYSEMFLNTFLCAHELWFLIRDYIKQRHENFLYEDYDFKRSGEYYKYYSEDDLNVEDYFTFNISMYSFNSIIGFIENHISSEKVSVEKYSSQYFLEIQILRRSKMESCIEKLNTKLDDAEINYKKELTLSEEKYKSLKDYFHDVYRELSDKMLEITKIEFNSKNHDKVRHDFAFEMLLNKVLKKLFATRRGDDSLIKSSITVLLKSLEERISIFKSISEKFSVDLQVDLVTYLQNLENIFINKLLERLSNRLDHANRLE